MVRPALTRPAEVREPPSHVGVEFQSVWKGSGGHFVRQAGWNAILLVLSIVILGAVTGYFVIGEGGFSESRDGPPAASVLLAIPFGLALWLTYRSLLITAVVIGEVMSASARIAEGDYSTRLEPSGYPDVRNLISTFNAMTERLESLEHQRRMLLADIAHELRNPLAIIRGKVEGIIDGVYPPTSETVSPLNEEISQMARLLDDLQTLSLAESGALALRPEPIYLASFMSEVSAAWRLRIESAGLTLLVAAKGDREVVADPFRLRQVIENLVSNAIRHTPVGGTIKAETTVGVHTARIDIIDTGSGIDPEVLPYIFDRFTKAADSGGSGLGLGVARRLIEAHGGRLTAWSSPGQGTRMAIAIPVRPATTLSRE